MTHHVLLIDSSDSDFDRVQAAMKRAESDFDLQREPTLKRALEQIAKRRPDLLVVELNLPDSKGLPTLRRVMSRCPDTPIVVLTNERGEKTALEAVRHGAQDYLIKDELGGKTLARVLTFALERFGNHRKALKAGLLDNLTGLYNRHGFAVMSEPFVKKSKRTKTPFFIFLAVLNGLERINRDFGKAEGNEALRTVADILRETFRDSDIVARTGAAQFAVLTSEAGAHASALFTNRLRRNRKFVNAQYNRYKLAMSTCAAHFEPSQVKSGRDLVDRADRIFGDYQALQKQVDFAFTKK